MSKWRRRDRRRVAEKRELGSRDQVGNEERGWSGDREGISGRVSIRKIVQKEMKKR